VPEKKIDQILLSLIMIIFQKMSLVETKWVLEALNTKQSGKGFRKKPLPSSKFETIAINDY